MTDLLLLGRLEDALEREACPVCHELDRATRQYLKHFLREGKTGELAWQDFQEARGFCPEHTRLVQDLDAGGSVEGLDTATVYGWLLTDLLTAIGADADIQPAPSGRAHEPRAGRLRKRLTPSAPCPACRDTRAYADAVLGGLQRFLSPSRGNAELRERFRRSHGLCLPHFREILGTVEDRATSRLLLEVQLQAVRTLATELASFREAYTDGQPGPHSGPARAAWRRVLDLFGGLGASAAILPRPARSPWARS